MHTHVLNEFIQHQTMCSTSRIYVHFYKYSFDSKQNKYMIVLHIYTTYLIKNPMLQFKNREKTFKSVNE